MPEKARKLSEQDTLTLVAEEVRKERTGVHARLTIWMNRAVLAWGSVNVEKDEERVRLANSAFRGFTAAQQVLLPKEDVKHEMDIFCLNLWSTCMEAFSAEQMVADEPLEELEMVIDPFIVQGGGTILFAPPGASKSYTLMLMALAIQTGTTNLFNVKQRRPLVINLERSRYLYKRRLGMCCVALGIDPYTPLLVQNLRGRSLMEIKDAVTESIKRHNVDCLFLDSISRAGFGDLNDNAPVNRIVDTLNNLCDTWTAVAHTPRADPGHVFGSVHFDAGADILVKVICESQEQLLGVGLQVVKANDLPRRTLKTYAYEFDTYGLKGARLAEPNEFSEIEAARETSLRNEVRDYLQNVGKASATEIAEELQRNRSNVSSLLKNDRLFVRVGKEGHKVLYGVALV